MLFTSKFLRTQKSRNQDPDVISDVTSPWQWGLLLGVTVSLAAVIYWGFFGTLVDSVSGTGVVISTHGIKVITSMTSGTIEYLDIKPGSVIVPNQILGRIYNPDVFHNIHKLQIEQKELQNRIQKLLVGHTSLLNKRKEAEQQKRKLIEEILSQMQKNRARFHEMVETQKKLNESGITSKVEYYNILNQNVSNENTIINTLISQLQSIYEQEATNWEKEENQIKLQGEQFSNQQEVELALRNYQEQIWLRSESYGVVLELLKHPEDPVSAGENVAIVSSGEDEVGNIRLVAYVSAVDGKKVRPGMSVYFSPASLRAADYGYIKGIVSSISLFPVSSASIAAELKNPDFATSMTQSQGGSVMRVEVDFLPTDQTKSGLQWTSKNGINESIEPGMVGTLLINTEYRRPMSYILPYLREHVLGIGKK